jgi:hypothetical protein
LYRSEAIDIESQFPDTYNVGYASPGEWLAYTVKVAVPGTYDIDLYVATMTPDRFVHLEWDGARLTEALPVQNAANSWSVYRILTAPELELTAGVHTLKFVFDNGSVNLDWLKIVPVTGGWERDAETLTVETIWEKTGAPAQGTLVTVRGDRLDQTRWRYAARSNERGQVALKFPRECLGGKGFLRGDNAFAREAVAQEVTLSQPLADLLQLRPAATLYGKVVMAPGLDRAVEGARVQLWGGSAETRVGRDGSFEFTRLTETAVRPVAFHGELYSVKKFQELKTIELLPGQRNGPVELVLKRGPWMAGRVLAKATGEPVVGAVLRACQRSGDERRQLVTKTDRMGGYRLTGLGLFPGAFDLEVTAAGCERKYLNFGGAASAFGMRDYQLAPEPPSTATEFDPDGLPRLTEVADGIADVTPGGVTSILGRTIEAEDYDFGGEGVAYHDSSRGNCVGRYRQDGVDIESRLPGKFNICATTSGEWLTYTVNVPVAGQYDVDISVATEGDGRALHFELDGKPWSKTVAVPNTGQWYNFKVVTAPNLALTKGRHTLKLVFDTGEVNVDWFRLVPLAGQSK